jgi:radical SAM protein with 4Fe4S-binding SPASM domain
MSFETARTAIDWIAKGVMENGEPSMVINFSGGEPLMNWDTIERTLEYTRLNIQPRLDVTFSLNTNASMITSDIAAVLKKHDVKMIVSLDGTQRANDRIRQTISGRPTFNLIQRGFGSLEASGNSVRAFHINLTSENYDCLDDTLIDFLSQNRILSVTLELDLTDRLNQPASRLVKKIMEIRDSAKEKGISVTGYWERPFARIIDSSPEQPAHFCRSMGGKTIDVLPDGSLYGCSYTNLKLGELDQLKQDDSPSKLIHSPPFAAMLDSRRIGQIEECEGCELEGVCGGGCYATVLHAQKKNDQTITDYRCEVYRQITRLLLLGAMEQSKPK